jgi:3-oxoacyl-[acyl-carrier-protein] synthase III
VRRSAAIAGWGKYVPSKVLTNFDLEKMVDTSDEWIVTRTGIAERRIAAPEECTSTQSINAANEALERAQISAADLDLIIVATNSPDYLFPATACLVQDGIGATKAGGYDLQAGCSGFIFALSTASQFIESGTYDNILVIGAETLSRLINWEDRATCVLFGDGAGAVVLRAAERERGLLSFVMRSNGSGGHFLSLPAGCARNPASAETVAKAQHFVHMSGNEIFKAAVRMMVDASTEAVAKAGLALSDIDLFVPHQANLRIIQAAAKRMELPEEKVWINIHKYGNTSAATIPISLCEAADSGRLKDGDLVVVASFGAGLTWGATVLRWGF